MESETEIIFVIINRDHRSATEINSPHSGRKFKIQEIVMGMGSQRKPIPYNESLIENSECKAEILENGNLRII